MAEDKGGQANQPARRGAAAQSAESESFGTRIGAGYADYVKALETLAREARRRCWEGGLEIGTELQAIQLAAQAKVTEAYHELQRALLEACGASDQQAARQSVAQNLQRFQQTSQQACIESQARACELQQKHAQAVADLASDNQAKSEAAYRDFLQATKEAWAGTPAEAIDPVSLAAAFRLAQAAAVAAACTRGSC